MDFFLKMKHIAEGSAKLEHSSNLKVCDVQVKDVYIVSYHMIFVQNNKSSTQY